MLTTQTRILSRNASTIWAVATSTRRNVFLGNTATVDFLTQLQRVLQLRGAAFGLLLSEVGTQVSHVFRRQGARETRHNCVFTLRFLRTRLYLEIVQLFDEVFRMLSRQFRIGRGNAVTVSTVATSAHLSGDGAALGSVRFSRSFLFGGRNATSCNTQRQHYEDCNSLHKIFRLPNQSAKMPLR